MNENIQTLTHTVFGEKKKLPANFCPLLFFRWMKRVFRSPVFLLFLFAYEFTLASLGSHSVCNPFMWHLEPIPYHTRNSEKKKSKKNQFARCFFYFSKNRRLRVYQNGCNKWNEIWNWMVRKMVGCESRVIYMCVAVNGVWQNHITIEIGRFNLVGID